MSRVLLDGVGISSLEWSLAGGRGLYSGARVMTTILAIGPRAIDLDRHLKRLIDHKEMLGLSEDLSLKALEFDVEKCLLGQKNRDWARIRIVIFRDENAKIRRLVAMTPESSAAIIATKQRGQKLFPFRDISWLRGSQIKTGCLGSRESHILRAQASGFDDVLWINGEGELAEATWSNIFLIGRTGDLVEIATPPPASGILEGITRRRIVELLSSAGIPVTERVIAEDEIPRFDEAFMTSSIQGLVPVTQIGGHRLHTLRPNAVFGHLSRLYQTWLELEDSSDYSGLSIN